MEKKFMVKGMHCKSCETLLTESIEELPGIKGVKADHKKGMVYVDFDESKIQESKIKEAIQKEGYEAR